MHIDTENYTLEFPKYARKFRTKIVPSTITDKNEISHLLEKAHISFVEEESEIIGVEGKHSEVLEKLKSYLTTRHGEPSRDHSIAQRLHDDLQFRVLLG